MAQKVARLFVIASRSDSLGSIARKLLRLLCSCEVSPGARFHGPPNLYHPIGIVVGMGVEVGRNVTIYQGVTLGASRSGKYPKIGNNVVIYPNSTVAGGITIGDGAIIGANSLIVNDVPAGVVVRSIPTPVPRQPDSQGT